MANSLAKQYLSEESLEALESSEGAKICIHRMNEVDVLKNKHENNMQQYNTMRERLLDLDKRMKNLQEKGLFAYLFRGKNIKQRKAALETEIGCIEKDICNHLRKTEEIFKELSEKEREIKLFSKKIKIYGLRIEDIVEAYHEIKKRLADEKVKSGSDMKINDTKKAEKKINPIIQNIKDNSSLAQPQMQ